MKKYKNFVIHFLMFFLLINYALLSQMQPASTITEGYFIDESGNILMNVNIWGHVNNPGSHLVYEGIDLINLLSNVGGPLAGANLKKIKILRNKVDDNGSTYYIIDLSQYYKTGDKSKIIQILPNDTIIIERSIFSKLFQSSNILVTSLQIFNIVLAMSNN